MAHIDGPWTISYDGTGKPDSVKRNPETGEIYVEPMRIMAGTMLLATLRCQKQGTPFTVELAERMATAHLIAAAPRMLAALEDIAEDIPYHTDHETCECSNFLENDICCHVKVFQAIRAAKGE